jgi:hypothetical protein
VIKYRRMKWAGYVERLGIIGSCTGFWWENLRKGDSSGEPGADEKIILRWIFRKWDGVVCTGLTWLRTGKDGGLL